MPSKFVTQRILNWIFLTRSSDLSKPLQIYGPTKFFQFSFPEIRKLVTQIVKVKLLELHLAIGFTKFFIKSNFICRGNIRTYCDLLVEYAEQCSLQEHTGFLWMNVAFHTDLQWHLQ